MKNGNGGYGILHRDRFYGGFFHHEAGRPHDGPETEHGKIRINGTGTDEEAETESEEAGTAE